MVLTATRLPGTGPAPTATVTAAGYRNTSHGWKLIAKKQIRESLWYSVGVCSLTVTQSKPSATGSPSMVPWDSVTVSLSVDPSIGCAPPYHPALAIRARSRPGPGDRLPAGAADARGPGREGASPEPSRSPACRRPRGRPQREDAA